jgi:hypothetical protein
MHRPMAWRLLAGPAAAAAVALVVTAPAFAAADAKLDVSLADAVVGVGAGTTLRPILSADRAVTVKGAVMTFDLAGGLTGVSLVNPEGDDCESVSPTRLVCSVPYEIDLGPDSVVGFLQADLKAAGDAVAGATGTVTATFSADGVAPVSAKAAVEVAESVDLVAGASVAIDVKPGDAFGAPLAVTNSSDVVVRGAGFVGYSDYAFESAGQFSNCVYRGRLVACLFGDDLEAGATYAVNLPFRLRADTAAPGTSAGEFEWLTAADYGRFIGASRSAVAVSGPALTLRKAPSGKAARGAQTDIDPDDNWQRVSVEATGQQGTDIAAVGAKVSGAAGATVTATVGVRNNGPAALDRGRLGSPATVLIVSVPPGTTVTTVPEGCTPLEGAGAKPYACHTDFLHRVGETVSWAFGLRIDRVVADATGVIEANPTCECDYFAKDIDRSNDKAALVINPAGGAGPGSSPSAGPSSSASARPSASASASASASPSPSVSASPGAGGTGGGLPITGPQTTAIAAVGVLFVVAGAAAVILTRRRPDALEG